MNPVHVVYLDHPKDIAVQTPFGTVYVDVIDGDHVFVDFAQHPRHLTARGQTLHGMLHLWRQPDGTFGPDSGRFGGSRQHFRPAKPGGKPASDSTSALVLDGVAASVTAWAQNNEAAFEVALRGLRDATREALRSDIALREQELAIRREELARLDHDHDCNDAKESRA
jgi:hypothetical protein